MEANEVLKGQKPTVELIRDYVNKNPNPDRGFTSVLISLIEMNQDGSAYNAVDKLQLAIICHNLAEEFYQLDRLLYVGKHASTASVYHYSLEVIKQKYKSVTSSDKYSKHDHYLDIKYTSKRKEK